MKSIMEEASSIMKAIEKGWHQAGKPQEFSIKVFEDATKNFLGISVKPAKIGIFYAEKAPHQMQSNKHQPRHQKTEQPQRPPRPARPHQADRQQSTTPRMPAPAQEPQLQERAEKKNREIWTSDMIQAATSWLETSLQQIGKSGVPFTLDAKNYYLKISFNGQLLDDQEKDRLLFRSFAYLIMQSLRNKFKKSFRGVKVILTSGS